MERQETSEAEGGVSVDAISFSNEGHDTKVGESGVRSRKEGGDGKSKMTDVMESDGALETAIDQEDLKTKAFHVCGGCSKSFPTLHVCVHYFLAIV